MVESYLRVQQFKQIDLSKRQQMSNKIRDTYPDKIPVIICKSNENNDMPDIDSIKYLVQETNTFAQLAMVIRKRVSIDSTKAIFMFVGDSIQPSAESIKTIYCNNKDIDGFLYVTYTAENTFG